eukprot:COSAG02_NODE_3158_length_7258_cov_2.341528_4_plen_253_part_00
MGEPGVAEWSTKAARFKRERAPAIHTPIYGVPVDLFFKSPPIVVYRYMFPPEPCALRMVRHQYNFLSAPQSVSSNFLETDRGAIFQWKVITRNMLMWTPRSVVYRFQDQSRYIPALAFFSLILVLPRWSGNFDRTANWPFEQRNETTRSCVIMEFVQFENSLYAIRRCFSLKSNRMRETSPYPSIFPVTNRQLARYYPDHQRRALILSVSAKLSLLVKTTVKMIIFIYPTVVWVKFGIVARITARIPALAQD